MRSSARRRATFFTSGEMHDTSAVERAVSETSSWPDFLMARSTVSTI